MYLPVDSNLTFISKFSLLKSNTNEIHIKQSARKKKIPIKKNISNEPFSCSVNILKNTRQAFKDLKHVREISDIIDQFNCINIKKTTNSTNNSYDSRTQAFIYSSYINSNIDVDELISSSNVYTTSSFNSTCVTEMRHNSNTSQDKEKYKINSDISNQKNASAYTKLPFGSADLDCSMLGKKISKHVFNKKLYGPMKLRQKKLLSKNQVHTFKAFAKKTTKSNPEDLFPLGFPHCNLPLNDESNKVLNNNFHEQTKPFDEEIANFDGYLETSICFCCEWEFPIELTSDEINAHINLCLDGQGELNKKNHMLNLEKIIQESTANFSASEVKRTSTKTVKL
jgi:hypothetical protein